MLHHLCTVETSSMQKLWRQENSGINSEWLLSIPAHEFRHQHLSLTGEATSVDLLIVTVQQQAAFFQQGTCDPWTRPRVKKRQTDRLGPPEPQHVDAGWNWGALLFPGSDFLGPLHQLGF